MKINEGMADPTEEVLREIGKVNVEGAIVKVVIDVAANADGAIDIGKVRQALTKAWHVVGVSRNLEKVARDVSAGEGVAELSPMQALGKYFGSKSFSQERARHLTRLAEGLLSE